MMLCVWCMHSREAQADPTTMRRWLIPAAAAADRVEQGPRSNVRVRCGTLSDTHGAQVLGRGEGANARAESERCRPDPSPPLKVVQPAPVTLPPPVAAPKPAPTPIAKPPRRAHQPPPAPVAAHPIRVVEGWSSGEANRVDRFTPTKVTRLSTVIAAGGVLWFLQSSFWASLLLLGLPIWRHVDLLAIAARAPDDEAADLQARPNPSEDESVARVLDDGRNPHSQRAT